jgi:carbonic anhydrase/acetyltransferase-like protein (isoleucine patch superfamily)
LGKIFGRQKKMGVFALGNIEPQVDESAWVASSAEVIGKVSLAMMVSVWPCTVIRGDVETIRIGAGTNVQDLSMLHADKDVPLILGEHITVGHRVILHGCTVGNNSMIGMGSTILNHTRIGKNCLVGANSLITEGKIFPDGSLIVGSPARVARSLTDAEIERIASSARHYMELAQLFRKELRQVFSR